MELSMNLNNNKNVIQQTLKLLAKPFLFVGYLGKGLYDIVTSFGALGASTDEN